mmetsp:Transcript_11115/g.39311  ORF Transcript_11115/g.39311 Transcript_11115/m.39311 type:complete len:382 (-) Transcript_11115:256-1401(-)
MSCAPSGAGVAAAPLRAPPGLEGAESWRRCVSPDSLNSLGSAVEAVVRGQCHAEAWREASHTTICHDGPSAPPGKWPPPSLSRPPPPTPAKTATTAPSGGGRGGGSGGAEAARRPCSAEAWREAMLQLVPWLDDEQSKGAARLLSRGVVHVRRCEEVAHALQSCGRLAKVVAEAEVEGLLREQSVLHAQLQLLRLTASMNAHASLPPPAAATPAWAAKFGLADSCVKWAGEVGAATKAQVATAPAAGAAPTLSAIMMALASVDEECVFVVRKINKLGFKAPKLLRKHFSTYGTVVHIYVSESVVRWKGRPPHGDEIHRRPCSFGFVQMHAAAPVRRLLVQGPQQVIKGVTVAVEKFERRCIRGQQVGEWQAEEQEEVQDLM